MKWFRSRAAAPRKTYDSDRLVPVILCSICTGEQTAGFRDRQTGKFTSVANVSSPADLEEFRREYGIEGEIRKIY